MPVGQGLSLAIPHGLDSVPAVVRGVLVCEAADINTGLLPGQEIDVLCLFEPVDPDSGKPAPAASVFADASNVYLNSSSIYPGNETNVIIANSGAPGVIQDFNNFKLKLYALAF